MFSQGRDSICVQTTGSAKKIIISLRGAQRALLVHRSQISSVVKRRLNISKAKWLPFSRLTCDQTEESGSAVTLLLCLLVAGRPSLTYVFIASLRPHVLLTSAALSSLGSSVNLAAANRYLLTQFRPAAALEHTHTQTHTPSNEEFLPAN